MRVQWRSVYDAERAGSTESELALFGECTLLCAVDMALHGLGDGLAVSTLNGPQDVGMLGDGQAHVVRSVTGRLAKPVRMRTGHLRHLLEEPVTAVAEDGLVKIPVSLKIAAVLAKA